MRSFTMPLSRALSIGLLVATGASAQTTSREALRTGFEEQVRDLAADLDGVIGLAVKDLTSGESFSIDGDMVFTQASTIKLQILLELFTQARDGKFSLDDPMTMKETDVTVGSGVLQRLTAGAVTMTIRDVATLMIIVSDNTATNMMIDLVGMENVNRTVKGLGFTESRLQRKMMDTAAWKENRENLATPNEVTRLLEMIHGAEVLDRQSCDEMLRILSIPKGSRIRELLPSDVRVAHKTGGVGGVVVDAGIVYVEGRPFVIAAMTNWVGDAGQAGRTISEIALAAYEYFDRLARSNRYGHR